MTRHCKACEQEFEQRVAACSECGGPLADEPLPARVPEPPQRDPLDAAGELEVIASSRNEAEIRFLEGLLRSEEIPTGRGSVGVEAIGPFSGIPDPLHTLLVPCARASEAASVAQSFRQHQALEGAVFGEPESEVSLGTRAAPGTVPRRAGPRGDVLFASLLVGGLCLPLLLDKSPEAVRWPHEPAGHGPPALGFAGAIAVAWILGARPALWVSRRRGAAALVLCVLLLFYVLEYIAVLVMLLAGVL